MITRRAGAALAILSALIITGTTNSTSSYGASTPQAAAAGPIVVVLDPGHNGQNYRNTSKINRLVDIGTKRKPCNTTGTATADGLSEASYNWEVALLTKKDLEAAGVTVVLTRTSNDGWGPCIDERARIANRAGAAALVSIHADGGPSGGRGFVVIRPKLVAGLTDATAAPSEELAAALVSALRDRTATAPSTYLGRGGLLASSDYGTLNLAKMPTVIVETLNLANRSDAALAADPMFRAKVAEGITAGVLAFVRR